MDELIRELESKINTYKKNRENIPLDVLKSKYAKAYNRLIDDIKQGLETIVSEYAHEGIMIRQKDIKLFMAKIDAALEEYDLSRKVSRLVFKEYNLAAALEEVKNYRQTVAEKIYQEYLHEIGQKK